MPVVRDEVVWSQRSDDRCCRFQRVWASPSRRLMSHKGTSEDITYPNICFMLDNFDQVSGGDKTLPSCRRMLLILSFFFFSILP